ncbi:ribosome silencing factor [Pseudalkalibacillus decolorationis]|uniref:ribosome silencing factor n=1 Tax=Pseudalkalibacillus decolorationis TaxID=163879 RepID=UPI0021479A0C|nr:ribosome silencing factor [Pseudalkalibacillus decolorationis]
MNTTELVEQSVKAMDDKRAENIAVLDVRGISLIADYFLICHGNSEKQVEAIARTLKDVALEQNISIKRLEGLDHSRWVLVDLGDVIIHVFHKDERSYYNLEKLWGDAPNIDVTKMLS